MLSVLPIAQLGDSSEGHWFNLADIKTSLTQLVECQPHELKAMGSIPKRGTPCLLSFVHV